MASILLHGRSSVIRNRKPPAGRAADHLDNAANAQKDDTIVTLSAPLAPDIITARQRIPAASNKNR